MAEHTVSDLFLGLVGTGRLILRTNTGSYHVPSMVILALSCNWNASGANANKADDGFGSMPTIVPGELNEGLCAATHRVAINCSQPWRH